MPDKPVIYDLIAAHSVKHAVHVLSIEKNGSNDPVKISEIVEYIKERAKIAYHENADEFLKSLGILPNAPVVSEQDDELMDTWEANAAAKAFAPRRYHLKLVIQEPEDDVALSGSLMDESPD